ncbi:hypothetical protein FRC03_004060 [Tulasnella sp. 419]|nr:hypothetical protein FRC02_004132 [Tulasnella sp. 418]KAG8970678.1 hypothetical protein FRC03_004060 [Tulasnella sp. 419]
MATSESIYAINDQILDKLHKIPHKLLSRWDKQGYIGVDLFLKRHWSKLVDEIIRCDEFGLILPETRRYALGICSEILASEIPVQEIRTVTNKLRRHYHPDHLYFDEPESVMDNLTTHVSRRRGFTVDVQ